jgi:flap endonuclease-1
VVGCRTDVGLPLRDLFTPTELPWEQLAGRSLAVDAYNTLYQFLATIRQRDGALFTDAQGQVTSHLIGLLYRTTSLLSEGVRPVFVFDGPPPSLKSGTLSGRFRAKEKAEEAWQQALAAGDLETARRKAAATSRLTGEMVAEARDVLDALGVPSLRAPSEGEAQAAAMAARGQVWACASEDYDSLLFGAPRLVRGLAARSRGSGTPAAQVIEREAALASLRIDGEELILVGILVGTDYNEGVRGYGPKRALKLAQEHLGWEASLRKVGLEPTEVEPVRELFAHPPTEEVEPPVFREPDEATLRKVLVDRHGFSPDRVNSAVARARRGLGAHAPRAARPHPEPPGRQLALERFG